MIKANQLTAYDQAAKTIEEAAKLLDGINIARLDPDDRDNVVLLVSDAHKLRVELFHKAHERFVAERSGDVKPGE